MLSFIAFLIVGAVAVVVTWFAWILVVAHLTDHYRKVVGTEFVDDVAHDIATIHPAVMRLILGRIGFKQIMNRATRLWEVQSVGRWLMTKPDIYITSRYLLDGKFRRFVDGLVTFVNANPAILNKRCRGVNPDLSNTYLILAQGRLYAVSLYFIPNLYLLRQRQ